MEDKKILLDNINKIHTTELGVDRIKRNLKIDIEMLLRIAKIRCWMKIAIYTNKVKIGIAKLNHWLCPLQTCCGIGKTNFKSSTAFIIAYISVR